MYSDTPTSKKWAYRQISLSLEQTSKTLISHQWNEWMKNFIPMSVYLAILKLTEEDYLKKNVQGGNLL